MFQYVANVPKIPIPFNRLFRIVALVDERLAACVNALPPMTSFYRWKGVIEQELEQQIVIKTLRERVPALLSRLRELHPYELPEFLVVRADEGSDAYLAWIRDNVES